MKLTTAYKIVRPSVVSISNFIENKDKPGKNNIIPFGSGVCIDKEGYIVTAYHVIKKEIIKKGTINPENDITVMKQETEFDIVFTQKNEKDGNAEAYMIKPQYIVFDEQKDIAVMKVKSKIPDNNNGEVDFFYPTIALPTRSYTSVGTEIAVCGYPLRSRMFANALPDLFRGIISRVDGYTEKDGYTNIMLDVNVQEGSSGGPVFSSEKAELIGVVIEAHKATDNVMTYDANEIISGSGETFRITNMVNCCPWNMIEPLYLKLKKWINTVE